MMFGINKFRLLIGTVCEQKHRNHFSVQPTGSDVLPDYESFHTYIARTGRKHNVEQVTVGPTRRGEEEQEEEEIEDDSKRGGGGRAQGEGSIVLENYLWPRRKLSMKYDFPTHNTHMAIRTTLHYNMRRQSRYDVLLSRDPNFLSQLWRTWFKQLSITPILAPPTTHKRTVKTVIPNGQIKPSKSLFGTIQALSTRFLYDHESASWSKHNSIAHLPLLADRQMKLDLVLPSSIQEIK